MRTRLSLEARSAGVGSLANRERGDSMYNIRKTAPAAITIAFALGVSFAQAAPISGSISFSGGGLTVPPVPSTSITGLLAFITQGPPVANSCRGSFSTGSTACDLSGPVTANNFNVWRLAGHDLHLWWIHVRVVRR